MKEPFVVLCPEITREHAINITEWLEDENVLRYLSDSRDAVQRVAQIVEGVNLPVLTHLFSQNGRFYIARTRGGVPVGFVRLLKRGADYEIVIVIGDKNNWGKRLGTAAIRESLKMAFFDLRAQRVVAKIDRENTRSIGAFLRAGFLPDRETPALLVFAITLSRFLEFGTEEPTMTGEIYITEIDRERLGKLVQSELRGGKTQDKCVQSLAGEIGRAIVVSPRQIPKDIITMNSRVLLHLDGEDTEISLVYPRDADWGARKMSVYSPIGTAILGYREGDRIEWEVPDGNMSIHIKKVVYQPEAAGDYEL